jgi:hypothetical protein
VLGDSSAAGAGGAAPQASRHSAAAMLAARSFTMSFGTRAGNEWHVLMWPATGTPALDEDNVAQAP